MLDSDTKRRIDSCRDILVGKVPDPKSQVEQITIALIYKFMDDMDSEAEELGGKRAFFAGEFAKYGWAKMLSPAVGGFEMLGLYSEAIARMGENPGVPELFRDIFKNAYLPYRDPETLRAFLKEINVFTYDHSEKLGDAFEYLLSVLGSQGDAGQFRTPRHIIDFIVSVVDPQKDETILDPACGTAGFLISSYKHILQANTKDRLGDLLSAADRARLGQNLIGYDISPDMVRLSLANLYLHGFPSPQVEEYDTLTSEDKWKDYADVILANPPFMSPKGGIKPHKRFSVQSNRSEVLFVDYIAEHLTPTGRAGVIVPEGIIFQSGTSYKTLREMLVKNYLVAVVSLPAGVFQPYSGVKTSVLVMDKRLAKASDSILFVKIASDGFGLGAQRRAVAGNDLPEAARLLAGWMESLRDCTPFDAGGAANVQVVGKAKIGESGDYNLSGERYADVKAHKTNYDMVPIGEICELINGRAFKPEDWGGKEDGGLPIVRIQNLNNLQSSFNYYTGEVLDRYIVENGELLFSWSGSRGTSFGAHIWYGQKAILNQHIFKVLFDEKKTTKQFLYYALNQAVTEVEENLHGGVGLVHITKGNLERIKIPLPPLAVQHEIVAEIEGYQKIIDGARQVVENYTPRIEVRPEWPRVELGEIVEIFDSRRRPITKHERTAGPYPYYGATGILDYVHDFLFDEPLVLVGEDGAKWGAGEKSAFPITGKTWVNNHAHVLRPKRDRLLDTFLITLLNEMDLMPNITGVTVPKLNQEKLRGITIPLPDLETQHTIVAGIEAEQRLVAAAQELVGRFEAKVKATIGRVWGVEGPAILPSSACPSPALSLAPATEVSAA